MKKFGVDEIYITIIIGYVMRGYSLIIRPDDVAEADFISKAIETLSPYTNGNMAPTVISANTPNIYIITGLTKPPELFGYDSPTRSLSINEIIALRNELDKGNVSALSVNPRSLIANSGMGKGASYSKQLSEFSPEEFEQHISRVFKVIEDDGATVTWNSSITDPFTPTQKRQIDVLVEKNGKRVHIECRHRSRRQGINWIEELYGKARAQQADQMIGVSSSGFTEGAINLARGLGVVLKEVAALEEGGVLWTDDMFISTAKFKVKNTKFTFFAKTENIPEYYIKGVDNFLSKGSGIWKVFSSALDKFASERMKMKVQERDLYRFEYTIDLPLKSSDFIDQVRVSTDIQFNNLTAIRVDSHVLNDLSQEINGLDAIVEYREMLGWKIEVISSSDQLKFNCRRVPEDSFEDEYVSSVISIEELDMCEKGVVLEVVDSESSLFCSSSVLLQYPCGLVSKI